MAHILLKSKKLTKLILLIKAFTRRSHPLRKTRYDHRWLINNAPIISLREDLFCWWKQTRFDLLFFSSNDPNVSKEGENNESVYKPKHHQQFISKGYQKKDQKNVKYAQVLLFVIKTFFLQSDWRRKEAFKVFHRPSEHPSLSLLNINWIIGNFYTPLHCCCWSSETICWVIEDSQSWH